MAGMTLAVTLRYARYFHKQTQSDGADKVTGYGKSKGAAGGRGRLRFKGVEAGWQRCCWQALETVGYATLSIGYSYHS